MVIQRKFLGVLTIERELNKFLYKYVILEKISAVCLDLVLFLNVVRRLSPKSKGLFD